MQGVPYLIGWTIYRRRFVLLAFLVVVLLNPIFSHFVLLLDLWMQVMGRAMVHLSKNSRHLWIGPQDEAQIDELINLEVANGFLANRDVSGKIYIAIAVALLFALLLWQLDGIRVILPIVVCWVWVAYKIAPVGKSLRDVGIVFRRFSKNADRDGVCEGISRAASRMVRLVTIQDKSFRGYGSILRYSLIAWAVLLLPVVVIALAALGWVIVAWLVVVFIWMAAEVWRTRDYFPVGVDGIERVVSDFLRTKERVGGENGVTALRFDDGAWQKAVIAMLNHARVAVFCVSDTFMRSSIEMNRHVIWEMSQALKCLGDDHIIFIFANDSGEGESPSVEEFFRKVVLLGVVSDSGDLARARFVNFRSEGASRACDSNLQYSLVKVLCSAK
jgi:hypothetical protein